MSDDLGSSAEEPHMFTHTLTAHTFFYRDRLSLSPRGFVREASRSIALRLELSGRYNPAKPLNHFGRQSPSDLPKREDSLSLLKREITKPYGPIIPHFSALSVCHWDEMEMEYTEGVAASSQICKL